MPLIEADKVERGHDGDATPIALRPASSISRDSHPCPVSIQFRRRPAACSRHTCSGAATNPLSSRAETAVAGSDRRRPRPHRISTTATRIE